jgi:hypothetical protein
MVTDLTRAHVRKAFFFRLGLFHELSFNRHIVTSARQRHTTAMLRPRLAARALANPSPIWLACPEWFQDLIYNPSERTVSVVSKPVPVGWKGVQLLLRVI